MRSESNRAGAWRTRHATLEAAASAALQVLEAGHPLRADVCTQTEPLQVGSMEDASERTHESSGAVDGEEMCSDSSAVADETGAQVPCRLRLRVGGLVGLTCVARAAIAGDELGVVSNEPEVHLHLMRCYHRIGVGAVVVLVLL